MLIVECNTVAFIHTQLMNSLK